MGLLCPPAFENVLLEIGLVFLLHLSVSLILDILYAEFTGMFPFYMSGVNLDPTPIGGKGLEF